MDARLQQSDAPAGDLEGYVHRVVAAVLERLCVPFLLLDAAGRVQFASTLVDPIIADGRHLTLAEDRRLQFREPAAAAELAEYLATLGHGRIDLSIQLGAADGGPPLFAGVSAFTPPTMPGHGAMAPLAALFIREGGTAEGLAAAQKRFGLTEAETAVLASIIGGVSIGEHARRRGISVHTARKQLGSVMIKVGVSRQAELGTIVDELIGRGRHRASADAMAARNESARAGTA